MIVPMPILSHPAIIQNGAKEDPVIFWLLLIQLGAYSVMLIICFVSLWQMRKWK